MTAGDADAAVRTTENSLYPDIDETFEEITYEGKRISFVKSHKAGFKTLPRLTGVTGQGMAIYDDVMALTGYQSLKLRKWDEDTQQFAEWRSSTPSALGKGNACQFAPSVIPGNTYPLLYVADLSRKCIVMNIDGLASGGSPSVVQTITLANTLPDGNLIIGDDGHLWCLTNNQGGNDRYRFIKFRKVETSEGSVTLTASDIKEELESIKAYPYSTYIWQGGKVKEGRIFFAFGKDTAEYPNGFVVYDLATGEELNLVNLREQISDEIEDLEIWREGIVIVTHIGRNYYLRF